MDGPNIDYHAMAMGADILDGVVVVLIVVVLSSIIVREFRRMKK
jgi:hypothetical protein